MKKYGRLITAGILMVIVVIFFLYMEGYFSGRGYERTASHRLGEDTDCRGRPIYSLVQRCGDGQHTALLRDGCRGSGQ